MLKRNHRKSTRCKTRESKRGSHLKRNTHDNIFKVKKVSKFNATVLIKILLIIALVMLIYDTAVRMKNMPKMNETLDNLTQQLEEIKTHQNEIDTKQKELEEKQKELEVAKAEKKAEEEKKAAEEKARQEAIKVAQAKKTTTVTSRGGNATRATTGTKAEYQNYAHDLCINTYGWTENDFNCLVKLWERESNWNPNAHNKSSGAHGIPQSLPASKMASEGADYYTNGKTQIRWGLKYIKNRYGTPAQAWAHSQQKGWY